MPLRGTWPLFPQTALILAVGRVMSSSFENDVCVRVPVGNGTPFEAPDGTWGDIASSWGGNHHVLIKDSTGTKYLNPSPATTPLVQGEDVSVITLYQPNARLLSRAVNLNGIVRAELNYTPANYTADWAGMPAIQPAPVSRLGGLALYMWAGFSFATLPPDWELGCHWMAASAVNGDRYLWPGWD